MTVGCLKEQCTTRLNREQQLNQHNKIMKHFIAAIFVFITSSTFTQAYNLEAVNKKAADAYEKAMLQLRDGFIKDAIPLLGKAIEYEPKFIDAYLSLAGVYGEIKNYEKSVELYDKAKTFDSGYFKYYYLP